MTDNPDTCPRCLGSGIDPEDDPIPGSSWELPQAPPCRHCIQPECTASLSGHCLRESQSETACDTDGGECVHGGQSGTEMLPMLFWDEPAGVVHHDGRITAWLSKAVNLAQSIPTGQLILRVETAQRLHRALTTALNDAAEQAAGGMSGVADETVGPQEES